MSEFVHNQAWRDLRDTFKQGPEGVLMAKHSGMSKTRQLGTVVKYYPGIHQADVKLHNALEGDPIRLRVSTNYQTSQPGTGAAYSLYPGQLVEIEFINGNSDGIYAQGHIVGTVYTEQDRPSPKHPAIVGDGTSPVRSVVDPGKDGEIGNVEVVDSQSRTAIAITNEITKETWGNESEVIAGPEVTYAERKIKQTAAFTAMAAAKIRI